MISRFARFFFTLIFAMSAALFTRREYLAASRDTRIADKNHPHRKYCSQLVTDSVKFVVKSRIGLRRIISSSDPFFNDIPLEEWDAISLPAENWNNLLDRLGDYMTLAGKNCILKEAARQIKEETA